MEYQPNKGQVVDMHHRQVPEILFVGDGGGAKVYLRRSGISIVNSIIEEEENEVFERLEHDVEYAQKYAKEFEAKGKPLKLPETNVKFSRLDISFSGANTQCKTQMSEQAPGYFNYFYGHCKQGISNISAYNRIIYEDVYRGIDVAFYGDKSKGMEFDFIVEPKADPGQIKLIYEGAEKIELNESKDKLIINTGIGVVSEYMPSVYQMIHDKKTEVKATYILKEKAGDAASPKVYELSYELGSFDDNYPLVIDPYSTYLGGSGNDIGINLAVDKNGNLYSVGSTTSVDFPVSPGAYSTVSSNNSYTDGYIAMFNPKGIRQWITYVGGTSADEVRDACVDSHGDVIVTGNTASSFDFPAANGYRGGTYDGFILKLNSLGNTLVWCKFYGGNDGENSKGIAADASDNLFIAGSTNSDDLSVPNAFQSVFKGGSGSGIFASPPTDAFMAKFDTNGNLVWGTYYGGASGPDFANDIAITSLGEPVVTGFTNSSDFYTTPGVFQPTPQGGADIFIVKLTNAGNVLWSTFYGSPGGTIFSVGNFNVCNEQATSVNVDSKSNIVIGGNAGVAGLPVSPNAYQIAPNGAVDAFVAKFDSSGHWIWGTYFGTGPAQEVNVSAIDQFDNVYIYGDAEQTIFNGQTPISFDPQCSYQPDYGILPEDTYFAKFSPEGKYICGSYIGGTGEDEFDYGAGGIAIYKENIYLTASTSGGFPVTSGSFQETFGEGSFDVFIVQLCNYICGAPDVSSITMDFSTNNTSPCSSEPTTFQNLSFTPGASCDSAGLIPTWYFQ